MRNFLINILFRLLGNNFNKVYSIQYLFGATTINHETRKKKWEKALARMWKDKDLLDYLYYQTESDKENAFKGKAGKDLVRGARIRTLFIIYQAHKAALMMRSRGKNSDELEDVKKDIQKVDKMYKEITDIE